MAMKSWDEKLSELTEMADDEEGNFTAWEGEFVASLAKQCEERGKDWEPSPKQDGVLTKIYNKVVLGIDDRRG